MGGLFDLAGKRQEIAALEDKTAEQDFWDDPQKAQDVLKRTAALRSEVFAHEQLSSRLEEIEILCTLGEEEGDLSLADEARAKLSQLIRDMKDYEIRSLLQGEHDRNHAIMSLHAGAGGTEAQDWVQMLYRMYSRWAEIKRYDVELLDILPGDEAGVKSVTFLVKGDFAYGFLKSEKGVHRLVRISPFDASSRRHTSFASVEVLPEIPEDQEVQIDPEDLRVDTFRSSGAGGQHVNKTDSAVRITHIPTGIVVSCQRERSQHSNRATALRILRSKLLERQMEEREREMAAIKGEQQEIAWGSQIRSYVFQPYSMVKDHRTDVEVGAVDRVMDGDIDAFIYGFLESNLGGQA